MPEPYKFIITNPCFNDLGYIIAVANIKDKHDRSAPSDYHWKILKCRMILFSTASVLASPDKQELKRIHIIFNKVGNDFDLLNSLFIKFSLATDGDIKTPTTEMYKICFEYTMTAKIAPVWNTVGYHYLINNRDFLTTIGPQDGLKYFISCNEQNTTLELQPVKINFIGDKDYRPGEWIRVLPSLNKAILEECCDIMPESAHLRCYKDLRRHWKNIHGYRLPEKESTYCLVRFWRGEPLTYPKVCITRDFPIIIPVSQQAGVIIISIFLSYFKTKNFGVPIQIKQKEITVPNSGSDNSQAVSLCTPTQNPRPL